MSETRPRFPEWIRTHLQRVAMENLPNASGKHAAPTVGPNLTQDVRRISFYITVFDGGRF